MSDRTEQRRYLTFDEVNELLATIPAEVTGVSLELDDQGCVAIPRPAVVVDLSTIPRDWDTGQRGYLLARLRDSLDQAERDVWDLQKRLWVELLLEERSRKKTSTSAY